VKKYFITGLLIWIPLAITFMVLAWIVNTLDQIILLLPSGMHPREAFGFNIPGLGVVMTVLIVLVTGLIAANVLGQKLVQIWEAMLSRIPVVKSIYYSVKQVSDTLFSGSGVAFRKVLLVRYPHPEAWAVAFQTGHPARDVADMLPEEHVGVFIPTTPSPVNGFFFFVRRADVIELDMNVDEALKYIVSMGVVAPPMRNPQGRAQNQ
jgi:uncharacterized membrane protein